MLLEKSPKTLLKEDRGKIGRLLYKCENRGVLSCDILTFFSLQFCDLILKISVFFLNVALIHHRLCFDHFWKVEERREAVRSGRTGTSRVLGNALAGEEKFARLRADLMAKANSPAEESQERLEESERAAMIPLPIRHILIHSLASLSLSGAVDTRTTLITRIFLYPAK